MNRLDLRYGASLSSITAKAVLVELLDLCFRESTFDRRKYRKHIRRYVIAGVAWCLLRKRSCCN